MTDAQTLLLPALLAMDVYHRDIAGGMHQQLDCRSDVNVEIIRGAPQLHLTLFEAHTQHILRDEHDAALLGAYRDDAFR